MSGNGKLPSACLPQDRSSTRTKSLDLNVAAGVRRYGQLRIDRSRVPAHIAVRMDHSSGKKHSSSAFAR